MLISMAAISGCVTTGDNEDQTAQASTVSPATSAFVITVGTDENPVTVAAAGTATNSCGDSCEYAYIAGTTLTVSTRAQNLADCLKFTSWSGACAGQGNPCTVVINSDISTFANFGAIHGCIPK